MGDLNCNMLEPTLLSTRKLNEILELYQMQQLINNPTRVTELTQSLLDVCITSNPEHIIYSGVLHLGIRGSPKTRNVERWNRKPGTPEEKTRNVKRWNRKHGTLERWNRKPGTPEQKTRNVERWKRKHGTLERWNRKPGTPEQKTRNAGTENPECRNRKPGTHLLTLFL